jgi:hypothetical protein
LSTGSSSPLSEPPTGSIPTIGPNQARPARRQLESSTPSKDARAEEEDEDAQDENARHGEARDNTAEVHAMVQDEYINEDGDSQASGDENENEAYRKDRNDSALEDMDEDEDPDAPLMPRLFEQFGQLKKVVSTIIKFQAYVDELGILRPKESPFGEFNTLRGQIRKSYKSLADPKSETDAIESRRIITTSLIELQQLVQGLDPDSAVSRRQTVLKNIYTFLFPDFLKILATATWSLTNRTESDDDITSPDLSEVIRIARCIVNLGSKASKWKTKVASDLRLVKPVKNYIVAPLRNILAVLERQRRLIEREEQKTEESLRRTQEIRVDRTEKENARRREQELIPLRQRLQELYMWRMDPSIESNLYMRTGHLAQPASWRKRAPQYDANGDPFEREEIFTPRLSVPPNDRPDEADVEGLSREEVAALEQGLMEIQPRRLLPLIYFSQLN